MFEGESACQFCYTFILSSSVLHVHVRYDGLQNLGEKYGNSALSYGTIKAGAS